MAGKPSSYAADRGVVAPSCRYCALMARMADMIWRVRKAVGITIGFGLTIGVSQALAQECTSATRSTGIHYTEVCGGIVAQPWTKYLCSDGSFYMFWDAAYWDTPPEKNCSVDAE